MLRLAGIAAVIALASAGVAWLSQSNLVSFFAFLAMNLALVLAVAFVVLAVGYHRHPSDPEARGCQEPFPPALGARRGDG